MKTYTSEIDGQRDFYEKFDIVPDYIYNTDGVWRGNLFEHKLQIDDVNRVLFQAIKYASRLRQHGEKLPAQLVLNDLNNRRVYIYNTKDFKGQIARIYFGGPSRENEGFATSVEPAHIISYAPPTDSSDTDRIESIAKLREVLSCNEFIQYEVDETNILGLAQKFYSLAPSKAGITFDNGQSRRDYEKSLKDAFLSGPGCEIRNPKVLRDRIVEYKEPTNDKFKSIMDALNPGALQRELGAYYTPSAYVKKMQEMLERAVDSLPMKNGKRMDYIVVDRCAGVGNLMRGLREDILANCVLSTLEPNEYAILQYEFGDKCAVVVPNTDAVAYDIIPARGESGDVVEADYIRERVNDPNCAVILVENPPYSEVAGGSTQKSGTKANEWKKSHIALQMAKEIKGTDISPQATNDLANLFIWSGFKHYLKGPNDSYILFSPTKYWRNQNLVKKQFADGFLCNRKHFHATPSTIGCIWWRNIDDPINDSIDIQAYDITADGSLEAVPEKHTLRKTSNPHSLAYDKEPHPSDTLDGVVCELNGMEFVKNGRQIRVRPRYSDSIVGYLNSSTFGVDPKHYSLTRAAWAGGNGFFLRSHNFIDKLPLFSGAIFPTPNWWERDVYSKSYDGNGSYLADAKFLKHCLFHTALSEKNKCRSFLGSDGRYYRNELCLSPRSLAQSKLDEFRSEGLALTEQELEILGYWGEVLDEAKKTEEYKRLAEINDTHCHGEPLALGVWQIKDEINVREPSGAKKKDGSDVMVYKHAMLNTKMKTLRIAMAEYYQTHIRAALFDYELLK